MLLPQRTFYNVYSPGRPVFSVPIDDSETHASEFIRSCWEQALGTFSDDDAQLFALVSPIHVRSLHDL